MSSHVQLSPRAQALRAELRGAILRVGWSRTAKLSGLERTNLHRTFRAERGGRGMTLATFAAVAETLGYKLTLVPIDRPGADG